VNFKFLSGHSLLKIILFFCIAFILDWKAYNQDESSVDLMTYPEQA